MHIELCPQMLKTRAMEKAVKMKITKVMQEVSNQPDLAAVSAVEVVVDQEAEVCHAAEAVHEAKVGVILVVEVAAAHAAGVHQKVARGAEVEVEAGVVVVAVSRAVTKRVRVRQKIKKKKKMNVLSLGLIQVLIVIENGMYC